MPLPISVAWSMQRLYPLSLACTRGGIVIAVPKPLFLNSGSTEIKKTPAASDDSEPKKAKKPAASAEETTAKKKAAKKKEE